MRVQRWRSVRVSERRWVRDTDSISYYDEGSRPTGVITTPEGLDGREVERLRRRWMARHGE